MSLIRRKLRVDGLLFDSDGGLVDSHDAAAAVWNQWAFVQVPRLRFPP